MESRSLDVVRAGIAPHQPAGPFEVLGSVHVHEEVEFAAREWNSCCIGAESIDQSVHGSFSGIEQSTDLVQALGPDAAGEDADAIVARCLEAGHAVFVSDQEPGEQCSRQQWEIAWHHQVLVGDVAGQNGLDRTERSGIRPEILEALMPRDSMGIPEQEHPAAERFEHVSSPLEHAATVGQEHARLGDPHASAVSTAKDGTGVRPGAIGSTRDHGLVSSVVVTDRMEAGSPGWVGMERGGIP